VTEHKSGENGQPVTTPLQMGKGKITSSDLQGSLAGKQISEVNNDNSIQRPTEASFSTAT